MKLIEFNSANSKASKTGIPTIRFNRSAGLISFSKDAGILLGLKNNEKIAILQDEENKADWYICVNNKEDGFKMREDDSRGFNMNCSFVANKMLDSIVKTTPPNIVENYKAAGFQISKTPVEQDGEKYFLIITSKILNPRK